MKNLLLIDSTVLDYQTFVDSVNSDTVPFVYTSATIYTEVDPSNVDVVPIIYKAATTRQDIINFIGDTTIDRIGIVFTMNTSAFLEEDIFFSDLFVEFIKSLITNYQVKNIDYLGCNTLQFPGWIEYYNKISETGVIIGASNNKTGNIQYGGDWIMESTREDIEFVYFTNTIEYYKYLLDTSDTGYNTVVTMNDYTVVGSGSNAKNQLGNLGGSTQIPSYSGFTSLQFSNCRRLACGQNHTLLLGPRGSTNVGDYGIYGAGANADYQLGEIINGFNFALTVGPLNSVGQYARAVACGEFHTLYADGDNGVFGTGLNTSKQLGASYSATSYRLVVNGVHIACGAYHSVVLRNNNAIWGSGLNTSNQLGSVYGSTIGFASLSSTTFVTIACGAYHTLALHADGSIWGTGLNTSNQLGSSYGSNTTFVQLTTGNIFIAISGGATHSLALHVDGSIWGTGSNTYNQLGSMYGSSTTFTRLTNGTVFTQVSCGSYGSYHSLAIDSSSNLWGTGLNTTNQLGTAYGSNTTFTQLLTNVREIACTKSSDLTPVHVSNLFSLSKNSNVDPGESLTMYGTNLSGVTYITFGTIQVSSFTSITQSKIVFTVPDTGTSSNIVKINIGGVNYPTTNSSINTVTYTVRLPTITSMTQSANGLITLNGANFTTPTVTITGGFTSGTVTKVSSSQLTFTPSGFIGSATFTVTDAGNTVSYTASFPTITSITQAANGLITLNGTAFTTSTVAISGGFTSGTVTNVSSTQLTFTPNSFIGSATFTVTDAGSSVSYTASFPTITSITQASNGLITLNGTAFTTPTVAISGGFTSGTVTKVSSTQLTFTPSGFIGSATFTVTDSGSSISYTKSFPTITSMTQLANGLVTLNGTNFTTPAVTISNGFTPGTVTKVSSTQLTFTPSAFIGSATFTVTDSGSTVSYIGSFPTITSFTPLIGPKNTQIIITGTNLGNVNGVLFGSVSATSPSVTSTTITVNAPTNIKSVAITLSDTNGNGVISSTNFTYNTNPTLFTTSASDTSNKLLSQQSLTDGIADTGVINIGSDLTTTNLLGSTKGITMTSSDNSTNVATTAFVKAQGYITSLTGYAQLAVAQTWSAAQSFGTVTATTMTSSDNSTNVATTAFVKAQGYITSLTGYAQLAVAQTWSALQTFSSGIQTSSCDALTATSALTVGSNLTSGSIALGGAMTSGSFIDVGATTTNTNLKGISNISTLNMTNIGLSGTPPFVYLPSNRFNNFFGATDTGWVQMFNVPNGSNWIFAGTNGITVPASYFVNWWVAKDSIVSRCRMRIVGTQTTQTAGTTLSGGAPFENAGLIFTNTMSGATEFSGMGFYQATTPHPNMWMTIENTSSSNAFYTVRMLIFRVA